MITTVIGNGNSGFSGDGGPSTAASLRTPEGLAVDTYGNLYLADEGNYRVREVLMPLTVTVTATTGTTLSMSSPAMAPYGGNLTLSATLLSGNTPLANDTITFSLYGNSVGLR